VTVTLALVVALAPGGGPGLGPVLERALRVEALAVAVALMPQVEALL
jgi:hypothetical protein